MASFSPSFILGVLLLLYLVSFVVFAIIRIATGISIQRIGYLSLRRIAYASRDGIRIDLRGLGLHLHRPTFAQPTWISLQLTELRVTLDLKVLSGGADAQEKHDAQSLSGPTDGPYCRMDSSTPPAKPLPRPGFPPSPRSQTWKRLTLLKERIKRLHEKIHWLRIVDVVALNSSFVIADVGSIDIGTATMAVDTRRKTVDRGRLFRHKKAPEGDQRPAEWLFVVKSVLFTPEGKDALEIVDNCSLNVHGLLYKGLAGLRDASVSLKLGRVHIPYDDLLLCQKRIEHCRRVYGSQDVKGRDQEISMTDVMEELDRPGSREEKIVQTVSDSKEFISSILRGIQEIQLAVSFIGMSKEVRSIQPAGSPLYVNVAMNEVGIDLHRLDPKSPAHRMYFSSKDIAHQALLAAISIAVSVDDSAGTPERLLYIPMATTTVKTTLPSKTVAFSEDKDAAERNANILFANLVVTSPSIDLDPKHMPLVMALMRSRMKPSHPSEDSNHRQRLISRLLPKANIKFSVHEPVIRVTLPPSDPSLKDSDEYDILISSISSIALDMESSHASAGDLHYSLLSNLRVSSHQLYYQTASGERHDLLSNDALELKLQVNASPEVCVMATGNLQTFSVHLVRPEITAGVRQITRQLRNDIQPTLSTSQTTPGGPNFLRKLPPWLIGFQFQGSDFGVEVAGVDPDVSTNTRGVALQLESWNAEYKIQKLAEVERPPSRRRATSHLVAPDEPEFKITPPSPSHKKTGLPTDGRRLAIHVRGFEGFIVEGLDTWESDSFLSLPRFEVAFTTSSDNRGPVFHLNSYVKTMYLQYSLYRYYAIRMAATVLKKAFTGTKTLNVDSPSGQVNEGKDALNTAPATKISPSALVPEIVTVDIKAGLLQVKAKMPADPPLLLSIFGLEAGRHRWAAPFMYSRLVRLCAEAPQVKTAWARLASIKNCRIDLRESRRKHGKTYIDEQSIDVSADFIRLSVPHQIVFHKVFDNLTNVVKATEQLHHRFETGTNEYILKKRPEEPKKVPRISIRCKGLLFCLEDGPFDWKLGTIYRIGFVEQRQRLAREDAYHAKVKKLQETQQHRQSSRIRAQSAHANHGRSKRSRNDGTKRRSRSTEGHPRRRSSSRSDGRGRRMRYDPEGACTMTESAKISIDQAWWKLQEHNAQSWKKRIDMAMKSQNSAMREIRSIFWGGGEGPDNTDETETILAIPDRPALMSTWISDLHIIVDKPSFPLKEYPLYMNRVGKGMPYDMEYSLLIPMNLQIDMGEARVTLRDYPLPLLHVPAIRPGQSPRLPSWSLKTDFVIAEEFRGPESIRHARVEIVPADILTSPSVSGGFAIDVRRTVSPVKTYSDVDIAINSSAPTSITWGTSYQPAIQDMMMIIEGFTKPQVDPSDRTGFWDKIRLSAHSRVNVAWKGDGDVHLKLKGSRDPYVVTGHGTGFVMCWRNNIRWQIHEDDDPRKFMTVTSGEYVLAIPDYSHQARQASDMSSSDSESFSSASSVKNSAIFKKVIMKLSGNVQWMAGLVFERNVDEGGRSFHFIPHYEVTLKNPDHAKAARGQDYDAFRGFRSHHIHLSVAVIAPLNRDWSVTNLKPSLNNYNTVHLSPRFFTHFFSWWSLFSGIMSLPVRQGKLFPGIEKSSKKFGRHLATIKYNLLLSPLFIAHIYKHKDAADYSEDAVSATGLKIRLDSFMLDLHQRREEFATQHVKGRVKQIRTSGMKINQAQLDFISADIRAVSASIVGTTPEDLKRATNEDLASYQEAETSVDMSKFTIPDNDFSWIDMDDFVELDWILPSESNPETKIFPLAYAPRFTYFRRTDYKDSISGDRDRSSPFGNEPTHFCIMSQDNDPRRVQYELLKERIAKVNEQMETHNMTLGEQELRVVRDGYQDGSIKDHYEMLTHQGKALESKKAFLVSMLSRLSQNIDSNESAPTSGLNMGREHGDTNSDAPADPEAGGIEAQPLADFVSDFNNRFIVHNVQLKWNNSLRNIILRYVHQVSQRRGFVYYMSRRAVKFILDIVQEQQKAKQRRPSHPEQKPCSSQSSPSTSPTGDSQEATNVEDRIQELLNDAKKFVTADDPTTAQSTEKPRTDNLGSNISEEYTPQNSYHVRLIAPQIQLQSEKNAKSVLIVTAKGMQLIVISIMDKDRITDDVSGLVQRRFSVDMDSIQFFVTTQKSLTQFLHLYSGTRYGTPKGSAWPPWVPIEVNYDFKLNPFGFSRVVQKTSASLRYDKYNTLRLKYNDELTTGDSGLLPATEAPESRIDHLWIEFPHIRAICDSSQYYTLYLIVLDLLLYSEPLEKVRSERLEKIMLASDFSDLTGAPEMVVSLQERIRQLEEIRQHFQIHAKYLDRHGWHDRLLLERDLTSCEDELFFMMKAITTSQRKNDERAQASQTNGLLRWNLSASEIVWHLMRQKNDPLVEIQLTEATYARTDNSDGSNANSLEIERIHGSNLLPDALYPEMLAPYFEHGNPPDGDQDIKMLKVTWYMLEAIAGIPVLDQFEVNLFPLKVQLEREVGKQLFDYIFPGAGSDTGTKSPFMIRHIQPLDDEDDSETEGQPMDDSPHLNGSNDRATRDQQQSGNVNRSLEMRLRPTMGFPERKPKDIGPSGNHGNSSNNRFKFFQHSNGSQSSTKPAIVRTPSKKASVESLRTTSRTSNDASSTNLASLNGHAQKPKKFALHRSASRDSGMDKEKPSDDLTQMMTRASNYMTLAYVKIPSVVLCLSYKGRGERNIEDVHNFVFRMPILEYRNKTWSNLDLALRLKKDVIRALISHTGAIIGNKLSHHRPNKNQQTRLRDITKSSLRLPNTDNLTNTTTSETSSVLDDSPTYDRMESPRQSSNFLRGNPLARTESRASSITRYSTVDASYVFEPPSIPESETEGDETAHNFMRHTFTRRFTTDPQKTSHKESNGGDHHATEDSPRKKGVLTFGKKILGSLN